jgi:ankyrin repeat protein
MTPLHWACFRGNVATLKYIYKLYPDGNVSCKHGNPVHLAITRLDVSITQHEHLAILGSLQANDDPNIVAEIIKFLLDCDPNMAFQELNGVLPITKACILAKNSTLNTGLKVIKMLYDAYPNAVLHDEFLMTLGLRHEPNLTLIAQEVQEFISTQLTYARQSNNINFITRRDSKGRLPLHIALHDNYTFGAIKLFVKGHSTAIHTPDSSGALPLHIACQHHDSASVVD